MNRGEQATVVSAPQRNRSLSAPALVSFAFGILCYAALPFVGAVIAIVFGHIAHREIRTAGGAFSGSGLATAGMILGYAQVALIGAAILAFGFIIAALV